MDSILKSNPDELAQDRVYAAIKEAITSLQFEPGLSLRTSQIATRVNASRTPVREALSRLAQEGLVQREGGWGYVVKHVSMKDVVDLYNVREALEVLAAKAAIPHLNDDIVVRLVALNKQAEQSFKDKHYENFLKQNRSFHKLLGQTSGNLLLENMLNTIHDRVRQVGSLVVRMYEPRAQELLIENRRILVAIRARDEAALVSAIQAHINQGREHVRRLIESPINRATPRYRT